MLYGDSNNISIYLLKVFYVLRMLVLYKVIFNFINLVVNFYLMDEEIEVKRGDIICLRLFIMRF